MEPKPQCARIKDGGCGGRMTKEHALIYAGKQIQEEWAIIDLCWNHHLGKNLDKRKNEWLALQKATDEDLAKYPKKDWQQMKSYLQTIYA